MGGIGTSLASQTWSRDLSLDRIYSMNCPHCVSRDGAIIVCSMDLHNGLLSVLVPNYSLLHHMIMRYYCGFTLGIRGG